MGSQWPGNLAYLCVFESSHLNLLMQVSVWFLNPPSSDLVEVQMLYHAYILALLIFGWVKLNLHFLAAWWTSGDNKSYDNGDYM